MARPRADELIEEAQELAQLDPAEMIANLKARSKDDLFLIAAAGFIVAHSLLGVTPEDLLGVLGGDDDDDDEGDLMDELDEEAGDDD